MAGAPIVDSHAHVIADDPDLFPYAPRAGSLPSWLPERLQTAEKLLDAMNLAGVEKAVLVQYASVHGYDCSYVMDTRRRWPAQFAAVCAIDPMVDAFEFASRWVNEGAVGLRIAAPSRDGDVSWVKNESAWRAASQLSVPLCVHFLVGASTEGLPLLRSMMERFPDVAVVLDHAANPPWKEPDYGLQPLLRMADLNLIIKFATVNLERTREAGIDPEAPLRLLAATFGAERMMWGSDAPNTPGDYPSMLEHMQAASSVLSSTEKEWFFGRTAQRLYPALLDSD